MLEGININLRALEKEDINLYHEWINRPEIFGMYNPLVPTIKEILQKILNESSGDFQVFIIEKKDKTRIRVIVYFIVKARPYELLEIGSFLIPFERKKGFCTEAVKIFMDFLFLSRQIVRIQAVTNKMNVGSQKVLEKAGFKKEGIVRKMMFNRGEWRDCILLSILREEWKEPQILKIQD